MKRIPRRELFLVTAPLGIVALGVLGGRLHDQLWGAHPRIVNCRVRPATPFEVWQGGQMAVTVTANVKDSPSAAACTKIDYSLSITSVGRQKSQTLKEIAYQHHCISRNNTLWIEQSYAYDKTSKPIGLTSRRAQVRLRSSCGAFSPLNQTLALPATDISRPSIDTARKANFRVTSAGINNAAAQKNSAWQHVFFNISAVSDQSQGLQTTPRIPTDWVWQTPQRRIVVRARVHSWYSRSPHISQVSMEVDTSGVPLPPPPGTKIRGLLAVNEGWPQQIEVEWPKSLNTFQNDTFTNFTTKLAPLLGESP